MNSDEVWLEVRFETDIGFITAIGGHLYFKTGFVANGIVWVCRLSCPFSEQYKRLYFFISKDKNR